MGKLFQLVTLTPAQRIKLREEVIEQIKTDIAQGDVTALDEMLESVPNDDLVGYLAEGDAKKYYKEITKEG